MDAARTSPLVTLIQVRERADVEAHERRCVLERTGVPEGRLRAINVLREPAADWERALDADAVIIGGAGIHSVTREYPFSAALADLVRRLVDARTPLFGCCWGHQFIAQALGGRVERDEARGETGSHEVELTEGAGGEPLLEGTPRRFVALMGHNDHVVELPPGGVELARTGVSANQMLRIEGAPVYGAQFHPEMTRESLIERLGVYREHYLRAGEDFDALCAALRPAEHTRGMLRRFLELHAL